MCGEMECDQCLRHELCNGMDCPTWELYNPEKAVEITEAWLKEHAVKTRADDFFEKFPNARKDSNGMPTICVTEVGYTDGCHGIPKMISCTKCWNEPVE